MSLPRPARLVLGVLGSIFLLAAAVTVLWLARSRLSPDPLIAGRVAYERREWDRAEAEARNRLKNRPGDREAWRLLARSLGRQGRDAEAQSIYRQRLGLEAMTVPDHLIAAEGLRRRGQDDQARIALDRARKQDPDDPEMLYALARLDAATGRMTEGFELAERLTRCPGWEARGWLLQGELRESRDDPAGTADALERAFRLGQDLGDGGTLPATARKRLARALLRLGRPAEAQQGIAATLKRGPDAEASWLLSRALLQEAEIPRAIEAIEASQGYGERDPTSPEPAPYVGTARCAECHRSIHDAQQSSRHARTFHSTGRLPALPLFDHPLPDPIDPKVRHSLRREPGRLVWETADADHLLSAVVEYAFGSGNVAITLVGHDAVGAPREMRLSHYGNGSVWDVTTGHLSRPEDRREYLGRPLERDGIRRCLECHTTSVRVASEADSQPVSDRGIGCERCHGPGGNHLRAIDAKFPDPAIGRPRLASGGQIMSLCAGCHSPKEFKPKPGDHLAPRFASPSLSWSRCFTESGGALSCVSCHDPHRDAETSAASYEKRCLACHSTRSGPPDAPAHETRGLTVLPESMRRTPCPVNPKRDCLGCHMPAVTEIVPHASFTDHHIRVRRPAAGPR
jgi:tetratricopeptide (TPR) repeat protein